MPLKRKCATDSSDAVEVQACHGEEGTKGCLGGKDESVGREQMRLRDGVAKGMERLKQLRLRECDVVDPLQEQESCRTLDKMLTSYNEAISILDKIIAFAPSDSVEKSQPDTYDDPNNKPSSTPIFKNYKREASTKWTMNIRLPPGVYHDDGYSWRKYGSKPILGSIYPRDYYRCTSKHKDCPARKQVQRCDADPDTIEVTYHGRHTCYKKSASKPSTIDQPFMP